MNFKKKIVMKQPEYCKVCRRKVSEGKLMNGYEQYLAFVCNDCFRNYFKYTAKIEESDIAVGLRPSDIHDDEYRLHSVIVSQVIRDMAMWLIVSLVIFVSTDYLCSMFYKNYTAVPLPETLIFLFMALVSFLVFIETMAKFVSGLFRGMNHLRRFLLFTKSAEFLATGLFAVNYIMWR